MTLRKRRLEALKLEIAIKDQERKRRELQRRLAEIQKEEPPRGASGRPKFDLEDKP